MTSRTGGSGGDDVDILCLGGADLSLLLGTLTTATSTGSADVTTTGIDPDAVLLCLGNTSSTTIASDGTASGFAVGASDGTTHGGYALVDEDAADTTNTESSYSSANAVYSRTSSGGTASDLVVGSVSMGTEKFSVNYTTVSGTARKGWFLAFGPAAAGGGAITIDGNVGGATAAGIAGQVGVSIDITGSVGNAAAAGTTGLPGVSIGIDATTGNAVAAGVSGVVDLGSNITIDGNVGAAVAAGVQGLPGVAITVDGAAGNAVAAGITGTVSLGNDITIDGSVGNAAADGILASLTLEISLAGSVGNATAAGVTGTVTLSGAEVFSAPPLVQRLETSTRIARTSASRSARLQPRNR